ncbi:hypothetical protein DWX12_09920 [Bifidobacterium pseudocatenulatum]|nr:hypothetical protein DWX12_09920 [Bifidobacterium pseudocatenulatum]
MMMTISELAERCEGVVSAAGIKKALVDGRIRGHQQDGPGTLWLADPTDPKVAGWIEEADRRHAAAPSRTDLERRIAGLERELAEEGERNLRLLQRAWTPRPTPATWPRSTRERSRRWHGATNAWHANARLKRRRSPPNAACTAASVRPDQGSAGSCPSRMAAPLCSYPQMNSTAAGM